MGGAAVAGGRTDRVDDTSRGGAAGCLCHLVDGHAGLSQGDAGHSVVTIEHNVDVMRASDWLIDLGPVGAAGGGRGMAEGTPGKVLPREGTH
ncbi:hypothetical protein GCM10017668_40510 [Streptomyces tuirus]|uniref:UvrABC system protein A n=1 Tax=Streptomyces tuirus TaxID=68278 RepID=A0A7G1NGA3_9ACTN|nr:hypothetical protein GCM10017668_40510 [Streptomyces tuirus]